MLGCGSTEFQTRPFTREVVGNVNWVIEDVLSMRLRMLSGVCSPVSGFSLIVFFRDAFVCARSCTSDQLSSPKNT